MTEKDTLESDDPDTTVGVRSATIRDGAPIWKLVKESGVLDVNSPYLYLLLCRDFADTCVVAERQGEVVGFATAYRLPTRPDVLFVWQIGVASSARRQGLALRMLQHLVQRQQIESPLRFVEATIAPSNTASRRLFSSLAEKLGTSFNEAEGFTESDFPEGDHESEPRILIGPL